MAAAVQNLRADNYSEPMSEASNSGIIVVRPIVFNFATPANPLLSATSTIKLCQLPGVDLPGFMLLSFVLDFPDMDSSTNVVLQLGDSTAADTFITTTVAGTIGQVAGRLASHAIPAAASGTVVGGVGFGTLPKSYTINDNLIVTIQAGPTTASTGKILGYITYTQWPIRSF